MKTWRYPFHILTHPIDGYEELRWTQKGSFAVSTLILLLFFISSLARKQLTGIHFNHNRPEDLNILLILFATIVLFALWVISNWAFCTLLDGEGTFRDIWIVSSYALVPHIATALIATVLSNFLILEEGVFLTWLQYFGTGWSVALVITALKVTHQYTFGKTLMSVLLTVVGIAAILFLSVLVVSLFQQVYQFVRTIISEIIVRR
jgi:hypothetical protein